MRFSNEIYDKCFPRPEVPNTVVDVAVPPIKEDTATPQPTEEQPKDETITVEPKGEVATNGSNEPSDGTD